MKIVPTFGAQRNPEGCKLWTVCYDENRKKRNYVDIFTILFDLWNDTSYFQKFFEENEKDLANPFWNNISIDQAIDKVLDESADFEDELQGIELNLEGYGLREFSDIFQSLHKNEFLFKPKLSNEKDFRKGKPDWPYAMLRLYGIELEENIIVITGGAIKLTEQMDRPHLEKELANLRRVKDYLRSEQIYSREGF